MNTNKEKRGNEKRCPETLAESFLKEARHVIPPSVPKRNQSNNQPVKKPPSVQPRRMASTPSATPAQSIEISNMFAPLETHDLTNEDPHSKGPRAHIPSGTAIDITSPEEFPSLPRRPRSDKAP